MKTAGSANPAVSSLITLRRPEACRSVHREAVKQPGAAGAHEVRLAAAALRSARGMRRVPGFRRRVVGEALAVDVAEHGRALRAAGPVAAGAILACGERRAVHLRAGEGVVLVRRRAGAAGDRIALLVERGLCG